MKYIFLLSVFLISLSACMTPTATNTARSGVEQLILSQAIDRAIGQIVFKEMDDKRVFIDESKFTSVDKDYVLSLLRHKILLAGGLLVDELKKAQVIVEIASGGIGTDYCTNMVGLPKLPLPIPTTSAVFQTPEISLWHLEEQTASCKLNINVLDAITGKKISLHPRLYGNAFFDRHMILMIFSWVNSSLGNDERNFPNAEDSYMKPDPSYSIDAKKETYYQF